MNYRELKVLPMPLGTLQAGGEHPELDRSLLAPESAYFAAESTARCGPWHQALELAEHQCSERDARGSVTQSQCHTPEVALIVTI